MASLSERIDEYVKARNEEDADGRRRILAPVWGDSAVFTDPRTDSRGVDALLDYIAVSRAARPFPRHMVRTSPVTAHEYPHSGPFFFTWKLRSDRERCVTEGIALGEMDSDGRLSCPQHGPIFHHPDVTS